MCVSRCCGRDATRPIEIGLACNQCPDSRIPGEHLSETVRLNVWSVRAEYRLDRSTGPDAGFYRGLGNELASEQQLFILAVNWQFGFHKPRGREL